MIERVLRDPEPRCLLRTAGFLFVAFPGPSWCGRPGDE